MTARVLVTGATGFIGRQTLVPLHELGFDVHVVGRRPPGDPAITFHSSDLFDRNSAARIVREVEASHLLHIWLGIPNPDVSGIHASISIGSAPA
jgi:uncharacterized protein YbjT (DUF2867 family)